MAVTIVINNRSQKSARTGITQLLIKTANTVLNVPRALILYFMNQFLRLTGAMRTEPTGRYHAGDPQEKPGSLKNDVSLG